MGGMHIWEFDEVEGIGAGRWELGVYGLRYGHGDEGKRKFIAMRGDGCESRVV